MPQHWEVVGGGDKGGILVRAGQATTSDQLPSRLSTGALVEELELAGERLNYKKLSGDGPETGWVSIALKDKALLEKRDRPAAAPAAAASAPAKASTAKAEEPWSVRENDYYVTLGVLFKKPGDDPTSQKIMKLTRKVGAIVHTTGKIWKNPAGTGFWAELDTSNGDSGAGEKPGYICVDAAGLGTPGPCLQLAKAEDGPPLLLKVSKPAGAEAWDKTDEAKDFVVLEKTPISEVKAVIGMLFGCDCATVFGKAGAAVKDDTTVKAAGLSTGDEVKFEAKVAKEINLIIKAPLDDYMGETMLEFKVKENMTMAQVKGIICGQTGLKPGAMIMANAKMGERISEGGGLDNSKLVSEIGWQDGDEIGFLYTQEMESILVPFMEKKLGKK